MVKKKQTVAPQIPLKSQEAPKGLQRFLLPLIAVVTFGCFFPSVFHSFLNWDDQLYVLNNSMVQNLNFGTLREMFTTTFDGHYHPFILLSFAIDHAIAGNTPWFYHAVNVLLHTLNACLVFLLIRKLTLNPGAAAIAALLWALHPTTAESVAWVTARKDVLYGFFYLASMLAYLYYLEKSTKKYYLIALVLFICAAFSKEQAAFLAPSLLAIDYLKGRKLLNKKVWLEKIPFFLIAIVFGLAVMYAQKETGYIKPLSGEAVSFANRLLLGSFGFIMYLFKWLIPYDLSAYYPYPFDALKPAPLLFWLSVLIVPAVGLLLFYLPRRSKKLTFALWFFILNIFVMLRFLQANPGDFYIADRYLYIASFGLVFAVAAIIPKITTRKKISPTLISTLLILLIALSGTLTVFRVMVWKDSKNLLDDILRKHPNAYTALNCRGDIYLEEGNLSAALKDFDNAVTLNANNDRAFANRGRARAMSGNIEGALQDLDRAVALNPKDPANYVNRGIARDVSGDLTGALNDLNQAIRLSPNFADAWVNRGNVYVHSGEYAKALADYNKALALVPDKSAAYAGRGVAKSNQTDFDGALNDFNKAEQYGYTQPDLYYQRGLNYYKMQQFAKALSDFTIATKKYPDHGMAWAYSGFANYNLGNYQQAINDLDNATRLNPGFDLAYAMRGMSYIRMGLPQYGCSDLHLAANLGNKAAAAEMERSCQ